ncbi:MAG: penicillin-binding transpeptidase domain-containing protein [Kiritimatiellaeota bacterium]|nr:penicillin-binding transpeptidase domain-containing protein [Kiritimatiellota bacterium]
MNNAFHCQIWLLDAMGRGAAIVIDLHNGDILAAATAPRFDLSRCTPRITPEYFAELNNDPERPLVNRAFSGIYPPGSVFKPVVALATLSNGKTDERETVHCSGAYSIGNRPIKCTGTHGSLALRDALARSCNPYFITLGLRTGWEPELRDTCARLGFGAAPSIGIPVKAGLLPSAEWKKRRFNESWTPGDTANLSIGQGFITATPLQVALMAAAIALDGKTLKPRLILSEGGDGSPSRPPEFGPDMGWSKQHVSAVKSGMYDAINAPHGTGRRIKIDGIDAAGKTGTAEYTERDPATGEILHKKHAWMICHTPADNPRYVLTVVAEDSDFGGVTGAEILRKILWATVMR